MSENPHRVEVFVEPDPDYDPAAFVRGGEPTRVRDVVFTCTAPPDAACRTHPVCDCDSWWECDDPDEHADGAHKSVGPHDLRDHPFVAGQACWIPSWFDAGSAIYVGADAVEGREDMVPPVAARGRVTVSFEEDYIEWDWAPFVPAGGPS